jgi:UPF0755 protein
VDGWTDAPRPAAPTSPGEDSLSGELFPPEDGSPFDDFEHDDLGHEDADLIFVTGPAQPGSPRSEAAEGDYSAGRHHSGGGPGGGAPRRSRAERQRRRRRRRLAPLLSLVVIVVLVAASFVLVGKVRSRFGSPDYSGTGTGSVEVRIASGDGADDVATTLVAQNVVKSTRAFINAAKKSGQASDLQPGVYRLKQRSSAAAAMTAILDPANRISSKVTIPEGSTYLQVLQIAAKQTKLPLASLQTAVAKVSDLGLPKDFTVTSAEGFLFPATYEFDPGSSADLVLQTMVEKFNSEYGTLKIKAAAAALKLSPYQVLIIASIAESEAKFDADRAKVARVIMNRIAAGRRLQIDASSAYAAKLAGKDPAKVDYASYPGPYNSYTHDGLPPTPLGNPGAAAITAAASPPAGNWLYYVNIDAAGHLGFFTDEAAFETAAATCKAKGWGCG